MRFSCTRSASRVKACIKPNSSRRICIMPDQPWSNGSFTIFNISINTNCLIVPNVQRSTDKKQLNTYTVVEPDLWPKPSATRAWRWKPACASSLRSASVPKLFMKVSLSSLSCENFCPSSVDVAQDWNKRSKMLAKECKPPTAAVNFSPIGGTAKISSMSLHASA